MSLGALLAIAVSCLVFEHEAIPCVRQELVSSPVIAATPRFTGDSLDVVLTAQASLVWDVASGTVLYERNAGVQRPVASLSKLASVWFAYPRLRPETIVEIPRAATQAARRGADIQLPVGQHTTAQELYEASLIASANDAMVSVAVALSGSEEEFTRAVNAALRERGFSSTRLANATGLEGGEQYSTAYDIRHIFMELYRQPAIRSLLAAGRGVLTTKENQRREYVSTNKLLDTYVPVLGAKTGYTEEAGENLVLVTRTKAGHELGAIVLGSENRFQDMKALVEWIERNYTWP